MLLQGKLASEEWTSRLFCRLIRIASATPIRSQDLLRVQLWISAVLVLSMLEMAVSYGDLDYLNKHGVRNQGLMVSLDPEKAPHPISFVLKNNIFFFSSWCRCSPSWFSLPRARWRGS